MTLSGLCHQPQSEALQSDPTNACGNQRNRKADHVEKRDPHSAIGNDLPVTLTNCSSDISPP